LPVQRGNVKISNLQLINAILYVAENGMDGFTKRIRFLAYCLYAFDCPKSWLGTCFQKATDFISGIMTKNFINSVLERFFRRLKRFRRISTRYDKLDILYSGFVFFTMIIDSVV